MMSGNNSSIHVRAHGRGTATHRKVAVERRLRGWDRLVVGNSDTADGTTRSTASSARSVTTSVAPNSFAKARVSMVAQDDDLLRTKAPGGNDTAQSDRAVADHCDFLTAAHSCRYCRMMTSSH